MPNAPATLAETLAGAAVVLLFILAPGAPRAALAHEVETKDGTVYEGKIVLDTDEEIVIVTTFEGRKRIPRSDVARVDDTTPPLREQLTYRAGLAKDSVKDLLALHVWAEKHGFQVELTDICNRILQLDPTNAKAHKLLGHVKVDGEWMTPEQKARRAAAAQAEAMRAKGLVPYEGRWITPEEKDALDRGLVKDGDEYVTEEEYHRRRGETRVGDAWVKVGEKEGRAWMDWLAGERTGARYFWGPNVDLYTDLPEEDGKQVQDGCEKLTLAFFRTLAPSPDEFPRGAEGRAKVHVFGKQPVYARFVQSFDRKEKCSELIRGWATRAQRQHAFWWVQPIGVVGAYKFPNTTATVTSNAGHHLGFVLLTQFRFNYRFPKAWLLEGFAYYLELEAYGYSDTFNVHRGGTAAADASGAPVWLDSRKWKEAVRMQVDQGLDPPLARIVQMEQDQLGYADLVKCWSVVDWMVRRDLEKFRAFIDEDKDRDKTHDDAVQETYGKSWRLLDQEWREYVRREYPAPAAEPGSGG